MRMRLLASVVLSVVYDPLIELFRDGTGGTFWDLSYVAQTGTSTVGHCQI